MADATAEPTLCLPLYRWSPLVGWPAPATVPLLETMLFIGNVYALNALLCAGWSTEPYVLQEKDHG